MITWLRTRLRNWLLADTPTTPVRPERIPLLLCCVDGKTDRFAVIGCMGLRIQVAAKNRIHLVGLESCPDPIEFWRVWKSWNRGVKISWEGGEEYDPSQDYR